MLIRNTNSGKNDDQDEAGVRDDLVVGRAVEAAAVVVGVGDGRQRRASSSSGVRQDREPAGGASRRDPASIDGRRRRCAALPSAADGAADRIRPAQGHRRRAAAARGLVQARAPRTDDDRRAQRRGQDDAAADARGRDVDRPRRAERSPRACGSRCTTSARRASATIALRDYLLSGCAEELADRGASWPSWRRRWRRARPTRRLLARYAARAGAARGARRLPVARSRDGDGARARLPRRGPGARAWTRSPAAS